ncbi:hypothetical protein L1987_65225 [Smallanthus sonchifolius]|uniref:Uncharacterized protein n=1 Tax=Smallanthus sonchifolius TaxID=185202 RepID=A0ACB9BTX9_9ASTR|nr:hypothetical protein L1987_65225 [Smallanthus sonchifolius]
MLAVALRWHTGGVWRVLAFLNKPPEPTDMISADYCSIWQSEPPIKGGEIYEFLEGFNFCQRIKRHICFRSVPFPVKSQEVFLLQPYCKSFRHLFHQSFTMWFKFQTFT